MAYKIHKPCLTYAQAMKRFNSYLHGKHIQAVKLGYFIALSEFGHLRYGVFSKIRCEINLDKQRRSRR
jgi:hypothetical protein